jgi:hypothetical protein
VNTLQILVIVACLLSGALAGINIDSFVVRFQAWRRLGVVAWAAYSREADLGNGLFLYPALAIGHAVIMIVVVINLHGGGIINALPSAYVAAGLAIVGLLLTIGAAPIMLGLKRSGDEVQVLERAFRDFSRWSLIRAVAQVLAFVATLCLLVRIDT